METGESEATILQDCCIRPGNAFDVAKVHACRTDMNGSVRFIIVAATEAGSVSLWDRRMYFRLGGNEWEDQSQYRL